ncbi:MAG: PA1571 family protein [Halopseudomonas sp.]|uniref:PA1571 family protein n=1 Tax=Halopseudomonas sp. TaxID=2901191 RepID=UPI0030036343
MSVHAMQTCRDNAEILIHPSSCTGGYLLDENGREVAITEQMVQQACAELEHQWVPAPRYASN